MFIIVVSFKKRQDILNKHLASHREFLDNGYNNNYFLASGQNAQHTGGIIISHLNDKSQLEQIIKNDPLYIEKIAEYKVIEFTPTKYQPEFSQFLPKPLIT